MTEKEFDKIFELFVIYYDNFEISEKKQETYYLGLKDMTYEQFKEAYVRVIQDREYTNLPSVAEIRKYAKGLKKDDIESRTQMAKQKLKKAVKVYGAYQTIAFDDPAIHAVIDSIEGGWIGLCKMDLKAYYNFFEFSFEKVYRAYLYMPYQVNLKFLGIYDKENEKENLIVVGNDKKYLTWKSRIDRTTNLLGDNVKLKTIERK